MTTEAKPRSLSALRDQIDALDRDILQLLARRMAIVAELAGVKRDQGVRVRDAQREREIIRDRRERAESLGLSAELIESVFRLIMWASRDYQASLKVEVPLDMTNESRSVLAFNLSYLFDRHDLLAEGMSDILGWFTAGTLRPPPIGTYPLADVARAHADLESGTTVGKLVLLP